MTHKLALVFDGFINLLAIFGGVITVGITFLVGVDVFMRYFLNSPMENVFEITQHSLVFMTFLVAPWVLSPLDERVLARTGDLGVFMAHNKARCMVVGSMGLVAWIVYAYQLSRTYICEKCGRKFKWISEESAQ